MPEEKKYAPGSIKSKSFSWGDILVMSFNAEKMIAFIQENTNERGWVNLDIKERKEVGQYGDTHTAVLNDFQPKKEQTSMGNDKDPDDDMPF